MALLDADDGFGHAACLKAIDYSVKVSKKYGISAIAIKNSSHCGALAAATIHAAKSGYICIGFTHADALVVPPNGIRPLIGTNPISFAFPRKNNSPICLDMATSSISWNNLISMNKKRKFRLILHPTKMEIHVVQLKMQPHFPSWRRTIFI